MAITIKRYPNRKLYDTADKTYVTLDRVADLIRRGADIQVVDYATGEDLTALTLTQIIFEQEKKQSGFLPRPLLTGLVKAGGETLEYVRRTLTKPLDLIAHVDDEIGRRIRILVEKNEMTEEVGEELRQKLVSAGTPKHDGTTLLDRAVQKYLVEHGLPSRNDYKELLSQLEKLTEKVEELGQDQK